MGYNNIEKIHSTIMIMNKDFCLKHVVKLANKRNDGKRELFHTEYTYMSDNQYTDIKYLKSIKLQFNSYLMIEEMTRDKQWFLRENVIINYMGIVKLTKALKKAKKWFKIEDLYFYNKNELCYNKEYKLQEAVKVGGKNLIITPTIIYKEDIGYEGVNVYINSTQVVMQLTIDILETLHYILKKMDLYQSGLSMLNYVRRPEFDKYNLNMDMEYKGRDDVNKFNQKYETSKGMDRYNPDKIDKKTTCLKGFFEN